MRRSPSAQGHYREAATDLEASLAREPDQPGICNGLAWLYATAPAPWRDPARALPLIERALRLVPDEPSYQNTLGVILTRLGRYSDAIPALEKSLATAPTAQSPFDLYFLAICHSQLGDLARADLLERGRAFIRHKLPAAMAGELRAFRARRRRYSDRLRRQRDVPSIPRVDPLSGRHSGSFGQPLRNRSCWIFPSGVR